MSTWIEVSTSQSVLDNPSPVVASENCTLAAGVYNKTTAAALAFFESKSLDSFEDALEHLIAIAFNSTEGLFLAEPGDSVFEAKHNFFEVWFLQKLMLYQTAGTYWEAAGRGEFRNLGNQARCALIDEIRKRSKDAHMRNPVRLDGAEEEDKDESAVKLQDIIGAPFFDGFVCPVGNKPCVEPSFLRSKLQEWRQHLTNQIGGPLFEVLVTICDLFPDHLSKGDVTRAIARARAVSEPTARKIHHELTTVLNSFKGDPVLRALVEMLNESGDKIPVGVGDALCYDASVS